MFDSSEDVLRNIEVVLLFRSAADPFLKTDQKKREG